MVTAMATARATVTVMATVTAMATNRCAGAIWADGDGEGECDDANMSNDDACTTMCTESFCGDGVLWQGMETCDDGNMDDDDACPTTCMPAVCGDGFLQTGVYQCTSPGYTVRPCIGNNNWGGVNTATCAGPTQTIEVICG